MNDKTLHFIAGFIIAVVISFIYNPWAGAIVATLAGIGKEIYDYFYGGTTEWDDFLVTMQGGCFGAVLVAFCLTVGGM
jgi:uncharacterized membrane protein